MSIKLRPYQSRDYKLIVESFKKNKGVLYQCPTGGGKSVVIAQLIQDNKDKKILFLSHKLEIITQMLNRLNDIKIKAGFVASTTSANLDSNILIGSISTVMRDKRIESLLDKPFDYIIIDEAHRTRANGYEKVLNHLFELNPNAKLFGVTATPYRTDKKGLDTFYEELVISDDIPTLIKDGYLCDYTAYSTKVGDIDSEVEKSGEDYKVSSLSKYMRKQNYLDYLVKSYKEKGEDRQMLVFCVDKAHAKSVMETYISHGYADIDYIDSDTPLNKRSNILQRYRDKKLKIIVCIETMTEGVDLPDTGVIQLARPTKSLILYLQMLGRGTRPKSDNSKLIILDCSGNTMEHGSLSSFREWSLNNNVNPSHLRKKNKIIARRKNGSYTDDVEEMDLLELEEVDPMQYMMRMGLDTAQGEAFNQDIVKKQYEVLQSIGEYVVKYLKDFKFDLSTGSYFSMTSLKFYIGNKESTVGIEQSLKLYTSLRTYGDEKYRLEGYIMAGKFSEFLLNRKHTDKLKTMISEIVDLEGSKINISKMKDMVKEFKMKQFQVELENYVQHNNTIKLPRSMSLSYIFPRDWGHFTKIVFGKNKLNKTSNDITFYNTDDHSIAQKVLGVDKLTDMLFSRWDEIKEFNKEIEVTN